MPACVDLPGNPTSSRDAPPLEIPRTTRRLAQCQNPERISADRLRSPFGPTSRDLLVNGTERENRVHSRTNATIDLCGKDEGRVRC